MSDYPNSGNLFSDASVKIFRKGKIEIDDVEYNMIIVQQKNNKTGEEYYSSYIESGKLYLNDKVTEDRDYNISGEISVDGKKKMSWGRKRETKNGDDYTRMSFADSKPKDSAEKYKDKEAVPNDAEERQDIPF